MKAKYAKVPTDFIKFFKAEIREASPKPPVFRVICVCRDGHVVIPFGTDITLMSKAITAMTQQREVLAIAALVPYAEGSVINIETKEMSEHIFIKKLLHGKRLKTAMHRKAPPQFLGDGIIVSEERLEQLLREQEEEERLAGPRGDVEGKPQTLETRRKDVSEGRIDLNKDGEKRARPE